MFHMVVCLLYGAQTRIGSANCFECHRIFASKPRSDRKAGGNGCVSVSCKDSTQSPGPSRNSTACAAKQELHAYRLLWGIHVDTSYRKYLTHTPSNRLQTVTYLRLSCAVCYNPHVSVFVNLKHSVLINTALTV